MNVRHPASPLARLLVQLEIRAARTQNSEARGNVFAYAEMAFIFCLKDFTITDFSKQRFFRLIAAYYM